MRIASLVCACLLALPAVAAARSGDVAALQVALRARGLYAGTVDGLRGPATTAGVRAFQARAGLLVDGIAGRRTRRALGRIGRHPWGSRTMTPGDVGWDVAVLQFKLALKGFPCGTIDGGYGSHTSGCVARFQRWAGLAADGIAGRVTMRALRGGSPRSPVSFVRPVTAAVGDRYGPRGVRFHAGLDFVSSHGAPVRAGRSGRVVFAGYDGSGFGNLLVIDHGGGIRTRYAHLSSFAVRTGQWVGSGAFVGRVGSTGLATGPHLHFEVTVRGANVDPLPALG
jgi:murein DD-endopeptidase MepM/ murein hydrolase activator NlpD